MFATAKLVACSRLPMDWYVHMPLNFVNFETVYMVQVSWVAHSLESPFKFYMVSSMQLI